MMWLPPPVPKVGGVALKSVLPPQRSRLFVAVTVLLNVIPQNSIHDTESVVGILITGAVIPIEPMKNRKIPLDPLHVVGALVIVIVRSHWTYKFAAKLVKESDDSVAD